MIRTYTQQPQAHDWLKRFQGCRPILGCVLGFTETGLIPSISAAGATPQDRKYTAIADAEFLYNGPHSHPQYALPPLQAGASPVLISRAVIARQKIPLYLFDAGLPCPPAVPHVGLNGRPARCVGQGEALDQTVVQALFQQGLQWGQKLARQVPESYLVLGECVVGGTTTALAVLTGLGWDVLGKINSSHPCCNHAQKWEIVSAGIQRLLQVDSLQGVSAVQCRQMQFDPLQVVAAVGDPMQIVVAGMAIAASQTCGVLLAGGTQMLAVHALAQAIVKAYALTWNSEQVVVGTTRWVAEDATGDTVGLAQLLQAPLLATQLSFATSRYAQLRAYEQGFVKEGVAAGGCAIAAHLYQHWDQQTLLERIEALTAEYAALQGFERME